MLRQMQQALLLSRVQEVDFMAQTIPSERIKQNKRTVDILVFDITRPNEEQLAEYKRAIEKAGHKLTYVHYGDQGAFDNKKQREEFFKYKPVDFHEDSDHSLKSAGHFVRGFNRTTKDRSVSFNLHVLTVPTHFEKNVSPFDEKRLKNNYSFSNFRGRPVVDAQILKYVDNYIKRNPNIQAMFAPFSSSNEALKEIDRIQDGFNQIASKNGRRIMVVASGGNKPKGLGRRSNTTGYQDFELEDSSYQHYTFIAQKKDTKTEKYTSTEPFAPQIVYQPSHFRGTSFTAPELGGIIFGMLQDAIKNGSLNGNTIFPAMVVDSVIDKLRSMSSTKGNITIQGKSQLMGLIKSSLDDIIAENRQNKVKDSDSLQNLSFNELGGQ